MSQPYQNELIEGCTCCTPTDLCLKAWFCPCIVYGHNHHRIYQKGKTQNYTALNECCLGYYLLASFTGFAWVLQVIDRRRMQVKYDRTPGGDGCQACAAGFFCTPCELIQTKKELDYIEANGERPREQAYHVQPPMVAAPQAGSGRLPVSPAPAPTGPIDQHPIVDLGMDHNARR